MIYFIILFYQVRCSAYKSDKAQVLSLRSHIRIRYYNPKTVIVYLTDAHNSMNWVLDLGEPRLITGWINNQQEANRVSRFRYILLHQFFRRRYACVDLRVSQLHITILGIQTRTSIRAEIMEEIQREREREREERYTRSDFDWIFRWGRLEWHVRLLAKTYSVK